MGTPTGRAADSARQFYARERRRSKQNEKAFGSSLFDFGAVTAGGLSANTLTLPAAVKVALSHSLATLAGDLGVFDASEAVGYVSAEAGQAGGVIKVRRLFPKSHQIQISRKVGAPAGAVSVYFIGPKSELTLIGQATFT